jgi:transcriptional regulator with XRE-family HTH domain
MRGMVRGISTNHQRVAPYQFFGSEFMAVSRAARGASSQGADVSDWDAVRLEVTSAQVLADPRLALVNQHPSPVITRQDAFSHVFRVRRDLAGLTRREVSAFLDRPQIRLSGYETPGEIINMKTGSVQQLAALLNIRFNSLPFYDAPLSGFDDIHRDLEKRIFTLGLSPHEQEFEVYVGKSFEQLVAELQAGEISDENQRILEDKFRMRLMPDCSHLEVSRDAECLQSFAEFVDALLERWHMHVGEFAELVGCDRTAIIRFFSEPEKHYQVVKKIAGYLGSSIAPEPPCSLEDLIRIEEPFYIDKTLHEAILSQRDALGWDDAKLCREADVDRTTYKGMMGSLENPIDPKRAHKISRVALKKVCELLKLRWYIRRNVPEKWVSISGDTPTDGMALGAALQERRCELRLDAKAVSGSSDKAKTLYKIEEGEINVKRLPALEASADYLLVRYDPFEALDFVMAIPGISRRDLGDLIKGQLARAPVSRDKLAGLLGCTKKEIGNIINGARSPNQREVRILCRLLKIYFQTRTEQEEWLLNFDRLCFEYHHDVGQICEQFGISYDEYLRIRSGNFSLDEPIIELIELRVDPDKITSEQLLDNCDKKKWARELHRRMQLAGIGVMALSRALGIPRHKLQKVLKGKFSWDDPIVSDIIAPVFRLYSQELVQIIAEVERGNLDLIATEYGIAVDTINGVGYFSYYNEYYRDNRPAVMERRERLLMGQLEKSRIAADDMQFLVQTGGSIGRIYNLTKAKAFYLLSLGDVTSFVIAWMYRNQDEEIDWTAVHREYRKWIRSTYGARLPDRSREPISIWSKYYEIENINIDQLEAAADRIDPYLGEE